HRFRTCCRPATSHRAIPYDSDDNTTTCGSVGHWNPWGNACAFLYRPQPGWRPKLVGSFSRHILTGRITSRQPVTRPRTGVLRGWDHGCSDYGFGENRRAARRFADLCNAIQTDTEVIGGN